MKKSLLTIAAALALVSCSQDDLMTGIENRPSGAIGVKAYVPTITRGTALNSEGDLVKAENGFDLFAFLSDDTQFMGTESDGVAFQGTGTDTYAWNYESKNEMKFWSEANGSAIKFYAVSPKKDKQPTGLTPSITADAQTLTYTVPTTCSEQVDLMYAVTDEYASNDETAEHITNGITLQFRHALSQIVFKAMTESELIYADIESVKITNLNGAGTFDLANAETYRKAEDKTTATFPWSYTGEANSTFVSDVVATTDINTDAEGNTSVATGKYTTKVEDGAISLTESTEALLLLPQNLKDNGSALEISCKVRYKRADNDIAEIVGSSTAYKTITVPVETSWQPGYKYTYTLIFTAEMGNPIKVKSVGVDEWNNATEEDVNVEEPTEEILGSGTEEDPYIIDSEKKLLKLATEVNNGDSKEGKFYKQTVDLDLSKLVVARSSEVNWTPIGLTSDTPFLGTYDAENHSVKNLYINVDSYEEYMDCERCLGLFGNIGKSESAKIKNLTVNGMIKGSMSKCGDNYRFDGVAASLEEEFPFELSNVTDNVSITISIDSKDDFIKLKERSEGNAYNKKYISYIQTTDIDLSGVENWEPIGEGDWDNFYPSYDGGNFYIRNIKIEDHKNAHSGLFGCLYGSNQIIKNIKIENIDINTPSKHASGGIVGRLYTDDCMIYNCHISGTITGGNTVGGIAGLLQYGNIVNCTSNMTIQGTDYVGGIVGQVQGSGFIVGCNNSGKLTITDSYYAYIGGITGSISNSSGRFYLLANVNSGEIVNNSSQSNSYTGGLIGSLSLYNNDYSPIMNCTGNINSQKNITSAASMKKYGVIAGAVQKDYSTIPIDFQYQFYKELLEGNENIIGTDGTADATATSNCYLTSTFAEKKDATNAAIDKCIAAIKEYISNRQKEGWRTPNFPYTKIELVEEGGEIKIKCTE